MFTGIIEEMGVLQTINAQGSNLNLTFTCSFLEELKIDQSLSHNGVCLTVVALSEKDYTVTAIAETLKRSNLGLLRSGDRVNLERALRIGDRLDGHMVQGHVDCTAVCEKIHLEEGSWEYFFKYESSDERFTIPKGSITIDGTSLTVVHSEEGRFSVSIIPYTYEHTCFQFYGLGTLVNIEFDMIGKYVTKLMARGIKGPS